MLHFLYLGPIANVPDSEKTRLHITIGLTNADFTETLRDKDSVEYKSFRNNVVEAVSLFIVCACLWLRRANVPYRTVSSQLLRPCCNAMSTEQPSNRIPLFNFPGLLLFLLLSISVRCPVHLY